MWGLSCPGRARSARTCSASGGCCESNRASRRSCTRWSPAGRPRSSPATAGGNTTPSGDAMLTGKLVRVRYARNRLLPAYLDVTDRDWREVAGHLLEVFREMPGKTRGEMEEEVRETIG